MAQGGFYETRRMKPGTVAIVVLLHGAAITAAMLAKEGIIPQVKAPPTIVDFIQDKKDPPPKPPESHAQQPEVLTSVPTVVRLPVPDPLPVPPVPSKLPELGAIPGPKFVEGPPTPVPPPPPPPPEVKLQPARAKANLASYVSDADYPSDAIRREEQGTTRFKLAVGPDGRVTGCTVIGSSGSAALDMATCRVMKSRARFAPARDTGGNAVADAVSSAIVWRLPTG